MNGQNVSGLISGIETVDESTAADERTDDNHIMAEFSIVSTGRQYQYGPYRYDRLGDAVDYARLRRSQGDELPVRAEDISRPIEVPDERQIELMANLGITFEGNAFHLRGYRYDRLADAVNYAHLRQVGIAS